MSDRNIPATTIHLSLVIFFIFLGIRSAWYFLPIYFEQQLSNVFLVGILTSVPSLITIMTDIPVGNMVQRTGERVIIVIASFVHIVPALLYLIATPLAFIGGKAAEGLGKSLLWNSSWSLSMKTANSDNESANLAIFMLGPNAAQIIGPIIGGWLIMTYTFEWAFYLWILLGAISIPIVIHFIGIQRQEPVTMALSSITKQQTYRDEWSDVQDYGHAISVPLAFSFLHSIVFSFFWMVIPLLLDELGTSYLIMGVILGAAAIPRLFQFIFGNLADKHGNELIIMLLGLSLIPLLLLMSTADEIMTIAGLFFLARIAVSGIQPAIHSLFDSHAPDEVESELTGFLELSKHTGQAIGPFMAGTVASIASLSASFTAAASIATIMVGLAAVRVFR